MENGDCKSWTYTKNNDLTFKKNMQKRGLFESRLVPDVMHGSLLCSEGVEGRAGVQLVQVFGLKSSLASASSFKEFDRVSVKVL